MYSILLHFDGIELFQVLLVNLVHTYPDTDLSRCAISSTVIGHNTDVVILVVFQRKLDGSIGSDEDGFILTFNQ